MGKSRSKLRKYIRRRTSADGALRTKIPKRHLVRSEKKKNIAVVLANELGLQSQTGQCIQHKRRLERTPAKVIGIKSPFKSPLYKNSPKRKKARSSRNLLEAYTYKSTSTCKTSHNSIADLRQSSPVISNLDINEFETLSDSTLSLNEVDHNLESQLKLPLTDLNESESTHVTNQLMTGKEVVEPEASEKHDSQDIIRKMIQLVPSVMKNLSEKDGLEMVMEKFFELVSEGKFPLDNISFLLWSEVVKWFSCGSTTRMRYSNDTKMFWKLGWRLFGRRFVNFMSGYKSHGDVVLKMADKGNYSPASSEINFAVPDINILREFSPYDLCASKQPGIFDDTILFLGENIGHISTCLTFDGKKLKQGLTSESGDVDLLGYEKGKPLKEKRQDLEDKLTTLHQIIDTFVERESLKRLAQKFVHLRVFQI